MTAELEKYFKELGINAEHLSANRLPFCQQAELSELEIVDIDFSGRPFIIARAASSAWKKMCAAATSENIILKPASGFRTYLYQAKLIEGKLAKGRALSEILTESAIPGFSEHHTGRAVDIIKDSAILESDFHKTDTFQWMVENGHRFNFRLSYPHNNSYGVIFEPWHWFFRD